MSPHTEHVHRNGIRYVSSLTLAFGFFILWIIYTANTGQSNVFIDLVGPIPYGDKAGHIILFGLLTLGANASSRFLTFKFGNFVVYRGSSAVAAFAVVEEFSQMYIPSRAWDGADLIADAVGILLFSALSARFDRR